MTKLQKKAMKIKESGKFEGTSGNAVWHHEWYRMPMGNLVGISYKNGKLVEVNNLGR